MNPRCLPFFFPGKVPPLSCLEHSTLSPEKLHFQKHSEAHVHQSCGHQAGVLRAQASPGGRGPRSTPRTPSWCGRGPGRAAYKLCQGSLAEYLPASQTRDSRLLTDRKALCSHHV